MEVDATDAQQAEQHVSELLGALVDQVPELKTYFGAQAIQGQAMDDEGGETH